MEKGNNNQTPKGKQNQGNHVMQQKDFNKMREELKKELIEFLMPELRVEMEKYLSDFRTLANQKFSDIEKIGKAVGMHETNIRDFAIEFSEFYEYANESFTRAFYGMQILASVIGEIYSDVFEKGSISHLRSRETREKYTDLISTLMETIFDEENEGGEVAEDVSGNSAIGEQAPVSQG